MESNNGIAIWQLASTVIPIIAVAIALAAITETLQAWTLMSAPVLITLMVLLLSRSFCLMHDCGHGSLFRSKRANRMAAFGLSLIHGMPQHPWSRGHAFHHRHNGNWDRYRGPSALITRQQYQEKTPFSQWIYRALRHPLLLFPGGFYYLIIKPRLSLLLSSFEFTAHSLTSLFKMLKTGQWLTPGEVAKSYRSSFFYTSGEFIDSVANTLIVTLLWWQLGSCIGHWHFWVLYTVVMSLSAAVMIAVFFVQHNFPGSYTSGSENWSYLKGALEGSSFLQLPAFLNWFTADIAYHHIHHLSERIPNYKLKRCHQANRDRLHGVHRLQIKDLGQCFNLILWDREGRQLISPNEVIRQAATAS